MTIFSTAFTILCVSTILLIMLKDNVNLDVSGLPLENGPVLFFILLNILFGGIAWWIMILCKFLMMFI